MEVMRKTNLLVLFLDSLFGKMVLWKAFLCGQIYHKPQAYKGAFLQSVVLEMQVPYGLFRAAHVFVFNNVVCILGYWNGGAICEKSSQIKRF